MRAERCGKLGARVDLRSSLYLFFQEFLIGLRYKRSEITAHGTWDYLAAKWKVTFPNTGF